MRAANWRVQIDLGYEDEDAAEEDDHHVEHHRDRRGEREIQRVHVRREPAAEPRNSFAFGIHLPAASTSHPDENRLQVTPHNSRIVPLNVLHCLELLSEPIVFQ